MYIAINIQAHSNAIDTEQYSKCRGEQIPSHKRDELSLLYACERNESTRKKESTMQRITIDIWDHFYIHLQCVSL